MKNTSTIIFGSVGLAVVLIIGLVFFASPKKEIPTLPIAVEEYSDFQCPACKATVPVLEQVREEFGDDIAFTYNHFPLESIHDRAFAAAVASEAAREQGKFQEYHDILFENQPNFSDEELVAYAVELGLDEEKFVADYNDNQALQDKVRAEIEDGTARNVTSTPTIFIDGRKFSMQGRTVDDFICTCF